MSIPSARSLLLSRKAHTILAEIPPVPDKTTARKIAEKTPYNIRQVSATIRSKLLNKYVIREQGESGYRYSRLPLKGGGIAKIIDTLNPLEPTSQQAWKGQPR